MNTTTHGIIDRAEAPLSERTGPLAGENSLSDSKVHILRHSLGLDEKGHGNEYRNYYCTGPDASCYAEITALAEEGLMQLGRIDGQNHFYFVTDAGKVEARKNVVPLPKLTKSKRVYQAYLHLETSLSFIEFLKSDAYADLRRRA